MRMNITVHLAAIVSTLLSTTGCRQANRVVAAAGSVLSSSRSSPPEADLTVGPRQELAVKTVALRDETPLPHRTLEARDITIGSELRPVAISGEKHRGLLLLENDSGRLIRLRDPGQESQAIASVNLAKQLIAPTVVRPDGADILVHDSDGITRFHTDGKISRRVPVFHAVRDFVVLPDGVIALNPLAIFRAEPIVITVSSTGARLAQWPEFPPDDGVSPRFAHLSTEAHLAACSGYLAVASVHAPRVTILTPGLKVVASIGLPFPGADQLAALGQDLRLARPTESAYWLPGFLGGIACADESLFVLLDLPVLRLYELDLTGRVKTVHIGHGASYRRILSLTSEPDGYLYALVLANDKRQHLVQLRPDRVLLQ